MKRYLSIALLLAPLALVGCEGDSTASKPNSDKAASGEEVTVQVLNYDESMKLIQSHLGKVVVVDVWNTSCAPCVKEFPGLVALHNKYGKEKVVCVSLSLDYFGGSQQIEEAKTPVLAFLQQQKATNLNILASEDTDTMLTKLDLAAPPVVIVYNQQGKVAKRFEDETGLGSFTYKDDIEPLVAELLKKE